MNLGVWNEALQWAVLLLVGFMVAGVLIVLADVRRRLGPDLGAPIPKSGLAVGVLAPNFIADDMRTGRRVTLLDFAGRRLLMAFMSPRCEPCKELLPNLNRFARNRRDTPVIVVALDDADAAYAREFTEPITVIGDADKAIQQAFDVTWTPLVYLLDEDGKVLNRTVSNSLIDLEDTLDGKGRPQGAAWVPTASIAGAASRTVKLSKGPRAPDRRIQDGHPS